MVNQWGRDGNFASGSAGSSRSAGGVLIPAIIALVIGAGGGYAGARFFSGVSASDIETRDKRIAELQQTLSDMKFDSQGANTEQQTLREKVEALEEQLAAAERTRDSLRAGVDDQIRRAKVRAQAEIDALQKTLDEAGDLRGQLGRARKSLKVSELQIIELEKTITEQKREIDRIKADAGKGSAGLDRLSKANAELQAALDDARGKLEAIPRLEDEIASLKEQLSQKSTNADEAARAQIASLQKERDSLVKQLQGALDAARDAERRAKEIDSLKQQIGELSDSMAAKDAELRRAAKELKQATGRLDEQAGTIDSLSRENAGLDKSRTALEKQVESLKAELADATATKAPDSDQPQDVKPADSGLTPRSREDVEKAVEDLPGFDNLSSAKQQTLVDMLVRGECVTDSLKAAFGHVSPVALRNLFRTLGGKC